MTVTATKQPVTGPSAFSPTAMKCFAECPKHFEYAYILKPEVVDLPTPALVLGNAVHDALAFLHRLPPAERDIETAHWVLRDRWARIEKRDVAFVSTYEEAAWGQRALEILERYSETSDFGVKPLAVEEWVRCRLSNGEALSGRLDRLDLSADGQSAEVVDYKSGKCRIAKSKLRDDLGAQVYAIAAAKTFNRPISRVRFLFLAEEDGERVWEPEPEELAAIEQGLGARIAEIRAETTYRATPGRHCRWCPYMEICPDRLRASLDELEAEPETVF